MGRALAAPQIGAPVRVVLVEIGKFRATMVNPEITDVGSEDFHVWDDCFSFPNLLVRVTRAHRATVRYTDMKGKVVTMELEGPMAELLQHELDHLDGILAVDQPTGLDPSPTRPSGRSITSPPNATAPPARAKSEDRVDSSHRQGCPGASPWAEITPSEPDPVRTGEGSSA